MQYNSLCYLFLAVIYLIGQTGLLHAQLSDDKYKKLIERDENVPQEKVEKAVTEGKKIQNDIINSMAKVYPRFKLKNNREAASSNSPKHIGIISADTSWQNGRTSVALTMELQFSKEELKEQFWRRLEGINMGDFFKISDIGDEAILVKNVHTNQTMTAVAIHFIKGRVYVQCFVRNHKRETAKNEKELMEIVKLIEPLIVARDNFDGD